MFGSQAACPAASHEVMGPALTVPARQEQARSNADYCRSTR